jgi:hypothetical protein
LTLSPFITGFELDAAEGKPNEYFSTMMTLAAFASIGFFVNLWLYIDDIKNRGSVLNEVKKKGDDMTNMMTSPPPKRKRLGENGEDIADGIPADIYAENKSTRDALKRSIARRAGEFS